MKTKFSTEEIKEWLEGWYVSDNNGGIKEENGQKVGLCLTSILTLLECDQDGIEAYFERKEWNKIGWDKERCDEVMEAYQKTRPVGKFL